MMAGEARMDAGAGADLLLVEDSETQALQIRRILERHGFTVSRAASAEAALDRLNRHLPDLVVCDYHLPGMNGGELARELRLNMRTRAIPVLMLTEASEPGLEREGLESGADAYVPKSSDQDLIVLRIRALLRQRTTIPAAAGEMPEPGTAGFSRDVGMFRRAHLLLVRGDGGGPLALLLTRDGNQVETAAGPEPARHVLQRPGADEPDCIVVDLASPDFDGIAFCGWLETAREAALAAEPGTPRRGRYRILGLGDGDAALAKALTARAYAAGVDDVVSEVAGPDAVALRIRAVVRRKLLQDETARIETDLRQRQSEIDRAREEAQANAAKAALAEALAQANAELGEANDRLREAQGKLVQAAKMASLGELVAGIAHEINNPLAFILAHQGTVERLLDQLSGPAPLEDAAMLAKLARARDRVGSMSLGLKRIQNLVLNLRKFSRLDESERQSVDVPDAIETVLALLTHKLGTGITVTRDYAAPRELLCQPALLNQVIMNIVGNAADALNAASSQPGLPPGKPPETSSGPPPGDAAPWAGRIDIRTHASEGSYVITVSDNGPGVPDGLRERIFEPFFTTKPIGAGTGLGLAISYSVVQAHGGSIGIETSASGGACFVVAVPRGGAAATPASEIPVGAAATPAGEIPGGAAATPAGASSGGAAT